MQIIPKIKNKYFILPLTFENLATPLYHIATKNYALITPHSSYVSLEILEENIFSNLNIRCIFQIYYEKEPEDFSVFQKAPTISNSSDHYNTYVQSNKYISQY